MALHDIKSLHFQAHEMLHYSSLNSQPKIMMPMQLHLKAA